MEQLIDVIAGLIAAHPLIALCAFVGTVALSFIPAIRANDIFTFIADLLKGLIKGVVDGVKAKQEQKPPVP